MARRILFLKIGCWLALLTAGVHLAGEIWGHNMEPANDTEKTLLDLFTTYRFTLPGGAQRTFEDFMRGFGLLFTVQLATMGGIGLVVAKRARGDVMLTAVLVRLLAVVSLVMLGISLSHFFIIPTICIGLMAAAFVVATLSSGRE